MFIISPTVINFIKKIINYYNIINVWKLFFLVKNPLNLIFYYFYQNYKFVKVIVKTPTGLVNIKLHNQEAIKTFFSIFIREDYFFENTNSNFIDIGSNIGLSSIYFLTRNKHNKVYCVEPDKFNQRLLYENLKKFEGRYIVNRSMLDIKDSNCTDFYLSKDGKHSRKKKIGADYFKEKTIVEAQTLDKIFHLAESFFNSDPNIILKIDVEGLEKDVITNFKFSRYPKIKYLFHEYLEFPCSFENYKDYFDKKIKYRLRNKFIVVTKFLCSFSENK